MLVSKIIFAINTVVPGSDVVEVEYFSNQTLLDADVILFTPKLPTNFDDEYYMGKPCISEHRSSVALEQSRHWQKEIVAAVDAGKLVIVYLDEPKECFRYTGDKSVSGTGRNQKVTKHVIPMNSYDSLPNITSYSTITGTNVKIAKEGSIIGPYWNDLSEYSPYRAEVTGDFSETLLESAVGNRVVGAIQRSTGSGALLYLPPVEFSREEFFARDDEGEYIWTSAALQLGKRLVSATSTLAKTISSNKNIQPPPTWALVNEYRLSAESRMQGQIIKLSEELSRLEAHRTKLKSDLEAVSWPRHLLYAKGELLETAVMDCLILMGFQAQRFDDGESEFDAIFSTPEGLRFIGEAEGRDNKAVDIGKFSQLERNIHEDFSRKEVEQIAKGVLFGNGHRLTAPTERKGTYTRKCLMAAKRTGYALVRTQDMFEPAKYLQEHPGDEVYAEVCRKMITETEGGIVKFPAPQSEGFAENVEKGEDPGEDAPG